VSVISQPIITPAEFIPMDIYDDEAFVMHEVPILSCMANRSSRQVGCVHELQLFDNMMMSLEHEPHIIV
jgi:hypothetical protein